MIRAPLRRLYKRPPGYRFYTTAPGYETAADDAKLPQNEWEDRFRSPRAAQSIHLNPLRRTAEHGIPSCDLQLRSFSVPPLDIFTDFALRAAYYLGLPAFGPVPLPRITERWTVPRDHFIFKKSQENFERITLRRLIQIQDGHPEVVQTWLAYLRKHQYYGIGMKANFWDFGPTDLDGAEEHAQAVVEDESLGWEHLGQTRSLTADEASRILRSGRLGNALGISRAVPRTGSPTGS